LQHGERNSRARDPTSSVSMQPEAGKAASARSRRLMNGQMLVRREKVFREKPLDTLMSIHILPLSQAQPLSVTATVLA